MSEENTSSKWVKVTDGDVPYYYCTDDVDESDGESGDETVYVLDLVEEEDSAADDGRHNENGLSVHDVTVLLRDGGEIIYQADEKESSPKVNNGDCASGRNGEPAEGPDHDSATITPEEHLTLGGSGDHHSNKLFQCLVCGKFFLKQSELHRHSRIHSGSKPYRCHVCGKQFTLNSNLKTHLRTHSGTRPYKCVYCPESFTYLHSLQRHARIHNNGNFFECRDCNRKFISGKLLEAHLLSHVKSRTNDLQAGLLNKVELELNVDDINTGKENNKLGEPGLIKKENTDNDALATGQSAERRIEPSNSGQDILAEDTHLKFVKTESFESDRDPTQPSLTSVLDSDLHERCKMANGFFKCPKCEKVTGRKWEFYRHYRKHLGLRPFQCNFCAKTFTVRCNLNTHLRLHTGVKPYHCVQCDERFMYLHSLQRHIRIHNNGKFLECEKCNRKFTNILEYKTHAQLHTESADITIEVDDLSRAVGQSAPSESTKAHTGELNSSEVTPTSRTETKNIAENQDDSSKPNTTEKTEKVDQCVHSKDNEVIPTKQLEKNCNLSLSYTAVKSGITKNDKVKIAEILAQPNDSMAQSSQRQEVQAQPPRQIQAFPRYLNYTEDPQSTVHNAHQKYQLHGSHFAGQQKLRNSNFHEQAVYAWKGGPFNIASEQCSVTARRPSSNVPDKADSAVSSRDSAPNVNTITGASSASDTVPVFILDDEQNIQEEVKPSLEESEAQAVNQFYLDDQDDSAFSVKEEEDNKECMIRLKENFLRSVKIENGCFVCQLCGKELWRKSEMQKHLRIHFNIKPFVCIYCSKSFTLNCNLKAHLRLHTGSLPYKCQECGQRFMYIHSLQRHARIHNNGKFFECIDCNRRFTGAKEHMEHMLSHKISVSNIPKIEEGQGGLGSTIHNQTNQVINNGNENTERKPNEIQGHIFVTKPSDIHASTKSYTDPQFVGSFERQLFNLQSQGRAEVSTHLKKSLVPGSDAVAFKEEVDDKANVFKPHYPEYYRERVKFSNEGTGQSLDKPYVCTVCSKRFTVKCNLKTHMRLHSGDKPYVCSVCGERFMYLHSLQRHVRIHNSGKFLECRDCNRRFISKEELAQHEAMHELGHTYQNRFPYVKKFEENSEVQALSPRCDGAFNLQHSYRPKFPYMIKSEHGPRHNLEPGYYPDIINVDYARFRDHISSGEDGVNDGQFLNAYPSIRHQFAPNSEHSRRMLSSYEPGALHKENTAPAINSSVSESSRENEQLKCIKSPHEPAQKERYPEVHEKPSTVSQSNENTISRDSLAISTVADTCKGIEDSGKEKVCALDNVPQNDQVIFPGGSHFGQNIGAHESERGNDIYSTFNKSHEEAFDIRGQMKEFQCPHCDRILMRKWDFDRHIRKHSGEKPFICEFCGKSFGLNSSLKAHLRLHTNEQPYSCEECGLKFTYLHSLQRHVRVHNNGHFLECAECNRRFTTKSDYINHMRSQHAPHSSQGSSLLEEKAENHQGLESRENMYVCHVST